MKFPQAKNLLQKTMVAAEKIYNLAASSGGVGKESRAMQKKECELAHSLAGTKGKQNTSTGGNNWELVRTRVNTPQKFLPSLQVWLVLVACISTTFKLSMGSKISHQPFRWSLIQYDRNRVIRTIVVPGAPSFQVLLCELVPIRSCLELKGYYMCPASNPGKSYCNAPGHYYCAYWGCETISNYWTPGGGKDRFLSVGWGPSGCTPPKIDRVWEIIDRGTCKFLYLNITNPEDLGWMLGRVWGVRYWEPGPRSDRGGHILIKKELLSNKPSGIGPNPVILKGEKENLITSTPRSISTKNFINDNQITEVVTPNSRKNPLWNILQASYQVLNHTHPNITKHCWLCYDINPPFYEAIAVISEIKRIQGINPTECLWNEEKRQGITMSQVSGIGNCIGTVPINKQHLCKVIERDPKSQDKTSNWLLPANNAKWLCSKTGLTPCVSLKIFNELTEYCVQVIIIPRLIYHPENYVYEYQTTQTYHLQKREPITALTVAALMAVGAAGAGTGIASLVQQNQKFQSLREAVDEDLAKIEKAMTALEKSMKSLSEVVLQNRRGLDLMFLQQGGLCAALREECCVYADHTGIVRDTMSKLREGLEKRQKEREMQQQWYESLFNYSSWITPLISTVAGPLILLLIGLTFGPCILNRLITVVKQRLETANIMLLQEQYERGLEKQDSLTLQQAREILDQFNHLNL